MVSIIQFCLYAFIYQQYKTISKQGMKCPPIHMIHYDICLKMKSTLYFMSTQW